VVVVVVVEVGDMVVVAVGKVVVEVGDMAVVVVGKVVVVGLHTAQQGVGEGVGELEVRWDPQWVLREVEVQQQREGGKEKNKAEKGQGQGRVGRGLQEGGREG